MIIMVRVLFKDYAKYPCEMIASCEENVMIMCYFIKHFSCDENSYEGKLMMKFLTLKSLLVRINNGLL